ncbi:DASH complex subunit SPC19 [Escovopsis weberi]|uniref:DASH complex subunit SPC19 n=1 Tax=Escovopsis weberi TaxID=150374 RepID=A0A0M8N1L1_ESCWE|nr:DASH complex subunit SPC19 [Escovopsis weberi]
MSSAAAYADCVASLRSSLQSLESSVQTLDSGVSDFPRLINVLKTVRHYELIPQPTLAAAEASLRDEIGPCIVLLLARADSQAERQERRIETLKARAALQQGRLARPDDSDNSNNKSNKSNKSKSTSNRSLAAGAGGRASGRMLRGEERLRARIVRQRKEALRYGIERLELEVLQKERELRKRLEG